MPPMHKRVAKDLGNLIFYLCLCYTPVVMRSPLQTIKLFLRSSLAFLGNIGVVDRPTTSN